MDTRLPGVYRRSEPLQPPGAFDRPERKAHGPTRGYGSWGPTALQAGSLEARRPAAGLHCAVGDVVATLYPAMAELDTVRLRLFTGAPCPRWWTI